MDNLFARYWLVDSVYKGRGKNGYISVYHIKCESPLGVFDKIKMPAKMYNTTAQGVLTEILQAVNSYGVIGDIIEDTVIADDFTGTNVTGFCPEQTARERLQWLLLLTNSYIKNFFDASIRIKRMTTGSGTMIPLEKTYWKPELTNRAYVTKIVVHGYTFTQGTPQNTDQYVTDGTTTWIVTDQRVQITNTNVPNDVPENIVEVEGVMIINTADYRCTFKMDPKTDVCYEVILDVRSADFLRDFNRLFQVYHTENPDSDDKTMHFGDKLVRVRETSSTTSRFRSFTLTEKSR
jgi:hypothetical protein